MKSSSSIKKQSLKFVSFFSFLATVLLLSVAVEAQTTTPERPVPARAGIGGASGTGMGAANGTGVGAANGRGVGSINGDGVATGSSTSVGTGTGAGTRNIILVNPTTKGRSSSATRTGRGTGSSTGRGLGSISATPAATADGNGTGSASGGGIGGTASSNEIPATQPDTKTYIKEMSGGCYYVKNDGTKVFVLASKCEIH